MKSLEGTATLGGRVQIQRPRSQSNTSTTIAGGSMHYFRGGFVFELLQLFCFCHVHGKRC